MHRLALIYLSLILLSPHLASLLPCLALALPHIASSQKRPHRHTLLWGEVTYTVDRFDITVEEVTYTEGRDDILKEEKVTYNVGRGELHGGKR